MHVSQPMNNQYVTGLKYRLILEVPSMGVEISKGGKYPSC
jgi:hypothetical protein